MTNEATGQAEALRQELIALNSSRGAAEFMATTARREVLPAFFSVVTSNAPTADKVNAIRNVKSALDDPEGSGLRERSTGTPPTVTSLLSDTKEVVVNLSPQARSTLDVIRANFAHYMKGSSVRTLNGTNSRILTEGVDGKYLTQAVMGAVFNKDEPPQFRQALMNTFLTSSPNPTFETHYFGPGTDFGNIDFTRERVRRAEETRAARLGRRTGQAWRRRGEVPGALTRVRAQLLREQQWEQGILNRGRELILTPPRRARTLLGRGVNFVRATPGRIRGRAGELAGNLGDSTLGRMRPHLLREAEWEQRVLNRIREGSGAVLHGVGNLPAGVGNLAGRAVNGIGEVAGNLNDATIGRFRRHPAQPAAQPDTEAQLPEDIQPVATDDQAVPEGTFEAPPGEIKNRVDNLSDEQITAELTSMLSGQVDPNSSIEMRRARLTQLLTPNLPTETREAEVKKTTTFGFAEDPNNSNRPSMEDAHTAIDLFGKPNQAYYAIYDGHGGKQTADFLALKLHENVLIQLNRKMRPKEALRQAYLATDSQIVDEIQGDSGATAVSALVIGNEVHVANVGDARAVLGRKGKALRLSKDHKADDPDEKKRVEKAGGRVLDIDVARVEGKTAIARAFGDKSLKKYVIAEPYLKDTTLNQGDFLILACDGLWDVLNDQEAVDLVKEENDPREAAELLKNRALKKGSTDNISVIVVRSAKQ